MAAGKRRRDGGNEFDVVRLDVVRRSIGAFASGKGGTPPSAREIKQIETSAREGRNADDASLLGWYAFQNKDFAAARDWFKTARDHSRDPKHLEGLILSLRNLGELEQARSVAQENLATGPLVRKAFIEIVATEITGGNAARPSPAVLTAMEGAIEQERSANGAQALGWYYFLQSDFKPAKLWFDKSSGWNPSDESILGQALVLQRLGDRKAYAQFLSEKKAQYPTLAKLAASDGARTAAVRNRGGPGVSGAVVKQAVGLYESGKYREAAEFMDRNQAKLDSGMNALRGWAHFHANNFDQAEKIFKKYSSVKGTDHGAFLAHIAGSSIPARWYQ